MYSFKTTVMDDKSFLTVHWDSAARAVVMEWKTFVQGKDFRDGLDSGLQVVIDKSGYRWLADLRQLGVVSQDDQTWSNEDWFPRALQSGITRMALVVPKSTLAKMSVKQIMNKVDSANLATHYFDSVDEARKWLSEQ